MTSIEVFFGRYLLPLREELQDIAQSLEPHLAESIGILHHHLGAKETLPTSPWIWNGWYVQPMLCLLACEACGGDWQQALPAAASIGLTGDFALIHNEIARGNRVRRASPTKSSWEYAQEINAGDTLFGLANLALGRLCRRGVPAKTVVDIFHLLNYMALAVATGQYLDISFEDSGDIAIADYSTMAEKETASTVCACEIGALIASAADVQREGLRSFGRHLGLTHHMCSGAPYAWDASEVQAQQTQAIAALERSGLDGSTVQALGELTLISFSSESLFCSTRDFKAVPP